MQLSSTWFICSPKQLTASPRVLSGLCSWPSRPCGEEMVFGSLCCSHGAGSQGSRSQPEGCRSLWMGLGSVPMAFWCWVAPFLSGSWSTQRATSEIPLSTSFLWSVRCIEIDETIKVISCGGNGSWGWVFGCWTNWAAEPVSGWEKSPCREGDLGDADVHHVQRTKQAWKGQNQAMIKKQPWAVCSCFGSIEPLSIYFFLSCTPVTFWNAKVLGLVCKNWGQNWPT